MSWKSIIQCTVATSALASCATSETKVLPPYTLANGATYQDVVSIGSNGEGTAPTVTQINTFELRHKGAVLVSNASGAEPGVVNAATAAAAGGLATSVPLALVYRPPKVDVSVTDTIEEPSGGLSDVRLKRDIAAVAVLANGLTLYRFRYLWSHEVFVGVMAQDVLKVLPQAVIVQAGGYLAVDYQRLGISMLRLRDWERLRQLETVQQWEKNLGAAIAA